jgi:prepilin-type N-terminal cleavage/methylation domain-containing protein
MKPSVRNNAFTIIEIIIALCILSVIVGFVMVKYPGIIRRSRDAQRESDLVSYRNALELYAMKHNGLFPTSGAVDITGLCTELGMKVSACKDDPKGGTYYYQTDSSGKIYTVWSSLEGNSNSFVACSTGENGLAYVTPAGGLCPDFQAGVTPTNTPTPGPTNTPTNAPTNTPTPTPPIYYAVSTASSTTVISCSNVCSSHGYSCESVGLDSTATDGRVRSVSGSSCNILTSKTCSYSLQWKNKTCAGKSAEWTMCHCQN